MNCIEMINHGYKNKFDKENLEENENMKKENGPGNIYNYDTFFLKQNCFSFLPNYFLFLE